MEGMAMQVALVPASALAHRRGARWLRLDRTKRGVEGDGHGDLGATLGNLVCRPRITVQCAYGDIAMHIAGRRIIGGNEEAVACTATPATKAFGDWDSPCRSGSKHAEIDDAVFGLPIGHRHVDARCLQNIERNIEVRIGRLVGAGLT
jgi:hypothetical protein